MTKEDYDVLAFVVNNHKGKSQASMCRETGLSKYLLVALMKTFGLNKQSGYAHCGGDDNEDVVQSTQAQEKAKRRLSEFEKHRIRLAWYRRKLSRADREKIVDYPYQLLPSLGVTAYEQAYFEYLKELYLWQLQ